MSDARALLKAKRQEARVNHPLAAYSSSGQLRCVACGTNVKNASSWQGHVGSKAHRVNATRLREAQQKQVEEQRLQESGKRKADSGEDEGDEEAEAAVKRRKLTTATNDQAVSPEPSIPAASNGFPANFFSDPSKAPPAPGSDDEDEEDSAATAVQPPTGPSATAVVAQPNSIDEEWMKFQQTVLNAPDEPDTYERATVFAEPVLAAEVPEGFPPREGTDDQPELTEAPLTEQEIRRRKEQDERELIMDRLVEEERAQEEADAKVSMLKQRLENLRKHREAAKQARQGRSTKS
ncbi:hypothetical protein BC629DRAFT_1294406 [Irpex lacteus]|nr:hypothetical protein BC629DRAFT_1294406 [Irpex lacteus]